MSRQARPALIGAFVIGAVILALLATLLLAGGELWQKKRRYVMYFEGSVYGLQVGAPVVFRGVTVGAVKRIGVAFDPDKKVFFVPVEVELGVFSPTDGNGARLGIDDTPSEKELLERGLRAQLVTQSLLTGQLYIELDFHPDKPFRPHGVKEGALPEIPTIPTTVQQLKERLQDVDFGQLVRDVSGLASALRAKAESRDLQTILQHLEKTTANLARLSGRLDQASGPLLGEVGQTLKAAQSALQGAQSALVALTAAAEGVKGLSSEHSLLQQNMQRALQETTQAARAVRRLSESIEQHPESLLRGREVE